MPWSEPRARAADTGEARPLKFIVEMLVASPGGDLLQKEMRMPDKNRSGISGILLQHFS